MLFSGALEAGAGAAVGDRYAQAFASALQFNVAAIALSALLLWRLGRRG
ncbi:hypothetical protein WJ970_00790 [Achromobacter xylosoxidans]